MKRSTIISIIVIIIISLFVNSFIDTTPLTTVLPDYLTIILAVTFGIILSLLLKKALITQIELIRNANFTRLILEMICLALSCIFGGLLSIPIAAIPGWIGRYCPIIFTIFIFILNAIIFSYRKNSLSDLANRLTRGKLQMAEVAAENETNVLLDTSVIIDGRIQDIAHCGFVPGKLIVPNFILQELQFIADSEDAQRRQRGRRGLETLANMQKDKNISVKIAEFDVPNVREADAKLMHVALELGCPILTNDYNLNKVAELQGIRILNVNDLTNAVKSILLPGEKLTVNVIQEGKEINQGVGYMEDGTMIVVENGRTFVGHQIEVTVSKILQTAAGRMIFARHEKELGVRR